MNDTVLQPFSFRFTRNWLYLFLAWTFPALVALSYYYLNQSLTAQPPNWSYALTTTLPNWYLWAMMTPLAFATATRLPLQANTNWVTFGVAHVVIMLTLLALQALGNLLIFRAVGLHDVVTFGLWQTHFTLRAQINILTYCAVIGVYYAYYAFQQYRQREVQATELQLQLTQAQLQALKMQLNPHFLFNTLNAIATLVRKNENKNAVQMLGKLGEFLRMVLESKDEQDVPLAEEVRFAEHYLDIEKVRFQDRLQVEFDVSPEAAKQHIPNLLLQPLVENALKHGISPHAETGHLRISAKILDGKLLVEVADNGRGLEQNEKRLGHGIGLQNTRERLRKRYGDAAQLSLVPSDLGGLAVQVLLPVSL